ncbi:MAG: hypothetical protein QOI99_723 [Actinomycetota bacterium]|nr:hypothetical protein [Actinomycetota bacterium]
MTAHDDRGPTGLPGRPAGRVLAVGIDAMTWWMVEGAMAGGRLPHLRGLLERSAVARLDDRKGHRTGLVWEQFLTGRSPAGVGRWQAVHYDPDTYRCHQVGALHAPFFAGENGPRTIAFDVPYLSTAFETDGAVVAAWGAHDPGHSRGSRPAGLLAEIDATFGPHPACGNDYQVVWHRPEWVERLGAALQDGASRRPSIVRWLQARVPGWELCLTAFSELHSASEMFWHGVDPRHPLAGGATAELAGRWLRNVYDAVDEALGELLESVTADDHVVVFCTHGMGTNASDLPSMVLLPELLHRMEIGSPLLRNPQGPPPGLGDAVPGIPPDSTWAREIDRHFPGRARRRVRQAARSLAPVAAPRLHRQLTRRPLAELDRAVVAPGLFGVPVRAETADHGTRSTLAWHQARRYERYWPRMHAFVLPGFYDTAIRINLEGRDRHGLVAAEAYRGWCDRLEATLRQLRNPYTGNPVVSGVLRPRAHDPYASAPTDADLVVSWAEPACALEHPALGVVGPFPMRRPGGHGDPVGFAAVAGPGIPARHLGTRLPPDVPATILALLGRAPEAGMEGAPLVERQPPLLD